MSRDIRTKLIFVFLTFSIVPILIVTLSSYNAYKSLVAKQVSLVSNNMIESTVERIDHIFKNINRITLSFQQLSTKPGELTTAEELKKLINNPIANPYDFYSARNNMLFFFNNLVLGNEYLNGIYLFLPDGRSITYGINTDLVVGYNPLQDEWYQRTLDKEGGLYISETNTKSFILNAEPSITFSRALYDANTRQFLGVLMLDCGLDIFKGIDKGIVPDITNMYLVNQKGTVLYDNLQQSIGQPLPDTLYQYSSLAPGETHEETKGGILHVTRPFPDNDWRIVASINLSKLNEQFGVSERLLLYIALTCTLIFVSLSIILSNLITKPIVELSKSMRKNKYMHLVTTKKYLERKDEIGVLYTEYNKMIQDIDSYIKESYQNKLITLDSQMRSLEAQINSHFLYNTLESINSIAEIEEVESIAVMTKALGDMFRYSIKTESELVPIQEELAHVVNYLTIQSIRYEDKIDFKFQVPDHLLTVKVLKLVLQPIIENAINHGLEGAIERLFITINVSEREHELLLEVTDNGIGISKEQQNKLKFLLSEPPTFGEIGRRDKRSIGLKNVHSRISLYYGNKYGLSLESEKYAGTKVTIIVPKTN